MTTFIDTLESIRTRIASTYKVRILSLKKDLSSIIDNIAAIEVQYAIHKHSIFTETEKNLIKLASIIKSSAISKEEVSTLADAWDEREEDEDQKELIDQIMTNLDEYWVENYSDKTKSHYAINTTQFEDVLNNAISTFSATLGSYST